MITFSGNKLETQVMLKKMGYELRDAGIGE